MLLYGMAYAIKILTLYKDLFYSLDSTNTNESLTIYTNTVTKSDTNPSLDDYLKDAFFCGYVCTDQTNTVLKKGKYLFIQEIFTSDETVKKAAEELYLESLWQELSFVDNKVYMRKLEEDGKTVFQLFREIQ